MIHPPLPSVIPAKAGIQFEFAYKHIAPKLFRTLKLDPCLRGDDEEKSFYRALV